MGNILAGEDGVARVDLGLKEELAESQEEKVLALVTAEERAAAHNLVQKKDLSQLTEGVGPHQDTVLAILCAQKQPHQPGRTLAQVLAQAIVSRSG